MKATLPTNRRMSPWSHKTQALSRACPIKDGEIMVKTATPKGMWKHGYAGTKIYYRWSDMRRRCNNPNHKCYKDYGGRGIKVCEEWNSSFESFLEWAQSTGYDESLTLDRIDNNGNYEPDNCRWISMVEQANNRRSSHYLEYQGKKMTITQWAEYIGIADGVIWNRLKLNWPVGEVLGFEPHSYPRPYHAPSEYKRRNHQSHNKGGKP